jgi:hypothetical protein
MELRRCIYVLTGILLTAACGSSENCPGVCPLDDVNPRMIIATSDGAAIIANARVVSGPCVHLLLHSAGEAGTPTGYSEVQVTYNGSTSIPPLCLVEVTSLFGESTVITTSVAVNRSRQLCCLKGSCCPKTGEGKEHVQVEFTQSRQTVAFAIPDSGVDSESSDTSVFDLGVLDGIGPIDTHAVDVLTTIDVDMFDAEYLPDAPLLIIDSSAESSP